MIPITDSPLGAVFAIRLQPGARRNAVLGELGDAVKIALTAPPIEGRANESLIEFLSDWLNVPRSAIAITAGEHSKNKRIRIAGRTAAQISAALESVLPPRAN
jgi:uncharacterized protein (TIGR00251 family)